MQWSRLSGITSYAEGSNKIRGRLDFQRGCGRKITREIKMKTDIVDLYLFIQVLRDNPDAKETLKVALKLLDSISKEMKNHA